MIFSGTGSDINWAIECTFDFQGGGGVEFGGCWKMFLSLNIIFTRSAILFYNRIYSCFTTGFNLS